jgi:ferritin-like metal-binding protein YciE
MFNSIYVKINISTMENNVEKALSNFVGASEEDELTKKIEAQKKQLLNSKTGLIERVDRIFVTEDGRQLLREQY